MPEDYPDESIRLPELDTPSPELIEEFRTLITDSLGDLEELPLDIDESGQHHVFIGRAVNEDEKDVYVHLIDVTIDDNGQTHHVATVFNSDHEGHIEKDIRELQDSEPTPAQHEQRLMSELELEMHAQQLRDIGIEEGVIRFLTEYGHDAEMLIYAPDAMNELESALTASQENEDLQRQIGNDKPSGTELDDAIQTIKIALAKRV